MSTHVGLQDARKGVLFDSFPPVLQLQLKRFEYDFQRDVMVKVRPSLDLALLPLSQPLALSQQFSRHAVGMGACLSHFLCTC